MDRRNFFKLLSAIPLIPLMPVKKKEDKYLYSEWFLLDGPAVVDVIPNKNFKGDKIILPDVIITMPIKTIRINCSIKV